MTQLNHCKLHHKLNVKKKTNHVFRNLIILCWTTFIAIWWCMWPADYGLGMPSIMMKVRSQTIRGSTEEIKEQGEKGMVGGNTIHAGDETGRLCVERHRKQCLTDVLAMICNLIKCSFISGYFECICIFNNPYLFLPFGVRVKCYSIAHSFIS